MSSNKKALVPKLRFPEFRDAGEWEVKPLSDCCFLQAGKFVRANNIYEVASNDRYPCYGGNGLRGYTTSFTHEGLYSLIGRQGAQCGNVNLAKGKFYATEHAVVVAPKYGLNTLWLFYKLTQMNLNQYATGQAQPGLSVENIEKLIVRLPEDEKEQQKIADCLSTLDKLITAKAEKIDALKIHKKGLMQRLFPREVETIPHLRFPEFRDEEEWKKIKIGKKVDLLSGYPFGSNEISENLNGIPLLRGVNITEGYIRHSSDIDRFFVGDVASLEKYFVDVNDIVIGMDGSKVGKNSALINAENSGSLLIQRVARLRSICESTIKFIFQQINSSKFHRYVDRINTSGGIPHISAKQIYEFEICFPCEKEQKKIVECLSSLDEMIAAQTEKLDVLKAHKKGLMQQLFPSPEALGV